MGERLVATTSCMKTLSTTLISSPRWELTTRKKRDRCVASPSKNQLLDRLGLVPDLKGLLKTHLLHRPGVVKSICTVTPLRKMPSLQQSQSSSIAFSDEFASFRFVVASNWVVVLVIVFLDGIPKSVALGVFAVFRATAVCASLWLLFETAEAFTGRTSVKNPLIDTILTLPMFGFWFLAWE